MKQIILDHNFRKLIKININSLVTLVEVIPFKVKDLSKEFLDYDTVYFDGFNEKNFVIDHDMHCLLLFFVDSQGMLFTTLRRFTMRRQEFYKTSIGCEFEIVIKEA